MDPATVKTRLIEVLQSIQTDSGYPPVPIDGATCPLSDLEGFDSKMVPVAIAELSDATGISIPNEKNVFAAKNGRERFTVDQIVQEVCKLAVAA